MFCLLLPQMFLCDLKQFFWSRVTYSSLELNQMRKLMALSKWIASIPVPSLCPLHTHLYRPLQQSHKRKEWKWCTDGELQQHITACQKTPINITATTKQQNIEISRIFTSQVRFPRDFLSHYHGWQFLKQIFIIHPSLKQPVSSIKQRDVTDIETVSISHHTNSSLFRTHAIWTLTALDITRVHV